MACGSGWVYVSVSEVEMWMMYVVIAASGVGQLMRAEVGSGSVTLNVVTAVPVDVVTVIALRLAGASGADATSSTGALRSTPTSMSAKLWFEMRSGSLLNLNALTSPGVQLADSAPPAGAQTWLFCLSTT